ncbi:MAG: ABC-2 transporter permease [Rhodospirillales bacterium]|nr:ABC-2 transporter permease [Rhodospirillales bacterium]
MLRKEFLQMRRDPFTIALTVGMPLIQLFLFGYAINADPKHLPTLVVGGDNSRYERTLLAALAHTRYFELAPDLVSEAEASRALDRGEAQFVLSLPTDFARAIDRGERPAILLEADGSDPTAIGNAVAALNALNATVLERDVPEWLRRDAAAPPPFEVRVQRRYNPEGITAYNIVPGLVGTILTFTMVVVTSLAVTRERERGTMENLLATPVRPLEVMLGKIVPYVLLGYVQTALILAVSVAVFGIPVRGSLLPLVVGLGFFIAANLAVGFAFSTIAANQLQAMQMAVFFILPSILLSGFMFPFRGMPGWAQALGEALPLTHMLRLVRGILLKGNGMLDVAPHLWPMVLFTLIVGVIAVRSYRETLD